MIGNNLQMTSKSKCVTSYILAQTKIQRSSPYLLNVIKIDWSELNNAVGKKGK